MGIGEPSAGRKIKFPAMPWASDYVTVEVSLQELRPAMGAFAKKSHDLAA